MKIGKILGKTCLGLGYAGLAAYGAMNLGALYESVKLKIEERRSKHFNRGYNKAWEERQAEIDWLRKENDRLYKEALQKSEAAE